MGVRKHFATMDFAVRAAKHEANEREEAVRVWRLVKKDGSLRFDALYLDETPKGDDWLMLDEVQPDPTPDE